MKHDWVYEYAFQSHRCRRCGLVVTDQQRHNLRYEECGNHVATPPVTQTKHHWLREMGQDRCTTCGLWSPTPHGDPCPGEPLVVSKMPTRPFADGGHRHDAMHYAMQRIGAQIDRNIMGALIPTAGETKEGPTAPPCIYCGAATTVEGYEGRYWVVCEDADCDARGPERRTEAEAMEVYWSVCDRLAAQDEQDAWRRLRQQLAADGSEPAAAEEDAP